MKSVPPDPLRPEVQPHKIEGMELAELDLMKGDKDDAADIAEKALADPAGDHADATYLLARIDLMEGDPEKASKGFQQTLALSKDPRTLAWSHIYLGRLYDTMTASRAGEGDRRVQGGAGDAGRPARYEAGGRKRDCAAVHAAAAGQAGG